jgi:hypothetical protein
MKLITLIFVLSFSNSFGQITQVTTITIQKEDITNQVYNKKTEEKLSETELVELFKKHPSIVLEKIYDKFGNLEKAYFDPNNIVTGRLPRRSEEDLVKVGEIFPPFVFMTTDGDIIDKDLLLGKWILIRFDLFGHLLNKEDLKLTNQEIKRFKQNRKIEGIIVLIDSNEEELQKLAEEFKSYKIIANGQNFHNKYSIFRFPTTVLIDPTGRVSKYFFSDEKIDLNF